MTTTENKVADLVAKLASLTSSGEMVWAHSRSIGSQFYTLTSRYRGWDYELIPDTSIANADYSPVYSLRAKLTSTGETMALPPMRVLGSLAQLARQPAPKLIDKLLHDLG